MTLPDANDYCLSPKQDVRQRRKVVRMCIDVAADVLHPDREKTKKAAAAIVAETMGVSKQYVYRWIRSGYIPAEQARRLEIITQGAVDRRVSNPDIFC